MTRQMPTIELDQIAEELGKMVYTFTNPITNEIETTNGLLTARAIAATQGKNASCLRASKPKINKIIIERERYGYTSKYFTGPLEEFAAAQVWRYVAFEASPLGQHHSMPVMAEFDCPFDMPNDEMRQFSRWCQSVADIILGQIKNKPGLDRWSRALGYS